MKRLALNIFFIVLLISLCGSFIKNKTYPDRTPGDFIEQDDGPYVLYRNNNVYVKYVVTRNNIKSVHIDSLDASGRLQLTLWVNTDQPGNRFPVKLKKVIRPEKSIYPKAGKLLAVSDIEGNFTAIRKLLQAAGVIDSAFNWIFGKGHVVLTGDFMDRGEQVTEVLWLIYSLEEKAKAAGGYVHFILGNHEIMNLQLDLRYLHKKYPENVTLLRDNYAALYGVNSELGRWLRSKNIVEKTGNILFAHGGISPEVNQLGMSLEDINAASRKYYADTTNDYPPEVDLLFSDSGPFWYRGYYTGTKRATQGQVDSTLKKFGAKFISTGHTITADTISAWYNEKIFNTDVHHAGQKSEALLFENNTFYRLNAEGRKVGLSRSE